MKRAFYILYTKNNLKLIEQVERTLKRRHIPFTYNLRTDKDEVSYTDYYVNDSDLKYAVDTYKLYS